MKKVGFVLLAGVLTLLSLWLWTPDLPRAELEARYLAGPADLRPIGPWRLHVRDSGPRDAPAVILLHGFGSSLQTWDDWAPGLSRSHRVIRIDLPGSGLSPPDPQQDYRDERSEQLLLRLMDTLGLARASLVGHSMGGRIAWGFAARHPERVSSLVLLAPDGFAVAGFENAQRVDVPPAWQLMRHVLPRPVLRASLRAAYARPESLTDARAERYHDLLRAPGAREALLERFAQTELRDPLPLLRQIRAPTLLVWGESDAMIPFVHAQDYLQAIAGSRLASFPGVGHLPHEEAPAASLEAVSAFLR